MKQLLGIFLFCSLTMPFLGVWLWMEGQIRAAKQSTSIKMESELPIEETVLWKFTQTEAATKLRWKHAREFEYQGEMYDIIRSESRGDTLWYWCYHDRKETQLDKALKRLFAGFTDQSPQNKNRQQLLVDFFRTLYIPSDTPFQSLTIISSASTCRNHLENSFPEVFIRPLYPPPKIA